MNRYDDPKHLNIKPRVAVIIASHINMPIQYGHSVVDDKLVSLKINMAAHKHFSPGVDYDLFVVDNGSINPEGIKYLESINAMKRENEGYGFGAWKWAWNELKDKGYEFFLFTEDDQAPCKNNWLKDIIYRFYSEPQIGAVGNIVEIHSKGYNQFIDDICDKCGRENLLNLDGCYTFTSANILRQVDEIGGLDVYPTGTDHELAVVNELVFQQKILELGYGIIGFDDGEHTLVHGSEIFTNDLKYRGLPLAPIINVNGIFKVPEVKEIFSFYEGNN